MLPQIKRPGRDDGEVEIEVVAVKNVDGSEISDDDPTVMAQNTLFPKESRRGNKSDLAKRGEKPVFTDEPTRLMPSKHGAKSPAMNAHALPVAPPPSVRPPPSRTASASVRPPPASMRPNSGLPAPSRVPSVIPPPASVPANSFPVAPTSMEFRPMPNTSMAARPADALPPFRDREESQTDFRPIGELVAALPADSKHALAVPSAGAIKAQVEAARAKRMADQRSAEKKSRAAETLEVTPVSISERFIVKGRPAFPWAVACVAMGIVAGLAVVFTGGRASAIAAFIDPSHETAPVVAAASPNAQTTQAAPVANDPAASLLAGAQANAQAANAAAADPALSMGSTTPQNVFTVGRAASTTPAAQAAAPADKPADKPAAVAATPHHSSSSDHASSQPKADPTPKPVETKTADNSASTKPTSTDSSSSHHSSSSSKPTKPAKGGGGGDVDSAAAADALAKAQLENSL